MRIGRKPRGESRKPPDPVYLRPDFGLATRLDTWARHWDAGGTDPAQRALQRELYWAEGRTTLGLGRLNSRELRTALKDFETMIRVEELQNIPVNEPYLSSPIRWRKSLKLRLYRFLRPVTRRYDRLVAELAELTTALSERLIEAEAELVRLQLALDALDARREEEDEPSPEDGPPAEAM